MKTNWRSHFNGTFWILAGLVVALTALAGLYVDRSALVENRALTYANERAADITVWLQRLEDVYATRVRRLTADGTPRFFTELHYVNAACYAFDTRVVGCFYDFGAGNRYMAFNDSGEELEYFDLSLYKNTDLGIINASDYLPKLAEGQNEVWDSLYVPSGGREFTAFVLPLTNRDGIYVGYTGVLLDFGGTNMFEQLLVNGKLMCERNAFSEALTPYVQQAGNQDVKINGTRYYITRIDLDDGIAYVLAEPKMALLADFYTVSFVMAVCCLLFLFMLYTPSSEIPSIFERFTLKSYRIAVSSEDASVESGKNAPPLKVSGERAMSTLLGGVMAIAALCFVSEALMTGITDTALWYGGIAFIMAALLVYTLANGFSTGLSHFTVIFLLASPVLIQMMSRLNQQILLWPVCGLLLSLFVFSRITARRYFYVFLILLFSYPLIELFARGSLPSSDILWALTGLMFIGCGLYVAMDAYIAYTLRNQEELIKTSAQLDEAQIFYTQKEKMAALGQLIAGVAHEINTPLGAIKASSENMESSAHAMFYSLIIKTRDFSDDDIEDFYTLASICSASVREMRNTMEMRRAKRQLSAFFNRIDPATAPRVVDLLTKMEICGMEKIENHIDVFKNPRIVELLELVQAVFPYLNATQNILYATSRVSKIVFALKSYSHTSLENEFVRFDLIGNILNILVLYNNQMKHGIEIIRDFDEDIPPVFGNPDELGQVWSNLVQNAIQAMNGVGTLTIRVNKVHGDMLKIVFRDTGGGIKPEHMSRMFDVFFTTKAPGEGSGLGLNICRKIVEKHGGIIKVESKPGQGAAFVVTLPINAVKSTGTAENGIATQETAGEA